VNDPALEATASRLRGHLKHIAELYPDVWKQVDALRAQRTLQWPSWCFMPLAGAYAIASGGRDVPVQAGQVAAIAALAAWRPTQGIYRFDPTVFDALWSTPLEGEIPTEVLHRVPEWCVYIVTPGATYLNAPSPGFFAFLEHDANDGRQELRISLDIGELPEEVQEAGLKQHSVLTALPIHLDRGGLVAGLEAALLEALRQARRTTGGPTEQAVMEIPIDAIKQALAPRVNLLLYLCSTNAELLDRKTGHRWPTRPTLTKTKEGMRQFPAERPKAWDVGYRLGAAIRHAQEAERSAPGDGTHASPRAHIRRAHWHAFWTGPKTGERKLVLRWLPPIPVNVDEDTDVVPTVHRVSE